MGQFMGVTALIIVGVAAWRITDGMSSDAISMAVGVMFGVMAGLPAALLVMASGRRRERDEEQGREQRRRHPHPHPAHYAPGYPQPPIIVLAQPGMQPAPGYGNPYAMQGPRALPAPEAVDVRQFKVVGEKEEWIEEW